ncbi:leucyl/phenylalanyl-tRNA--protein transferase [Aurantiacibacter sp. MUD11]|uniref:leucyl/phenylalanyl-tRNA--protein transferase n=1 Tax=Aurantiacibacter sp. MUD11 TaxID=3003265 RepID=UPI0022AA8F2B|nr:leucyl/phenylalanyl-tRNA--protein transferase [Aurantiacibacter sp. MUD11]WAT17490.1 leucyl/phenylalanyl-tRNA--protein transferase [Aurantiacibacter sp. MUD11]
MHAPAPKVIPPEVLLLAYRSGVFPMADSREDDEVFWVEPRKRAVFPLDGFHCSRSLAKVLKQDRYRVTVDAAFPAVIEACAQPRPEPGTEAGQSGTWISHTISASYRNLHRHGHAHSVECWAQTDDGETLVGGLYGVAFDRAFCGESMFSRADNASKVALAWLIVLMRRAGYVLLDCQFMTEHLASMGAIEVSRDEYQELLAKACDGKPLCTLPEAHGALLAAQPSSPGKLIAQSLTQTS